MKQIIKSIFFNKIGTSSALYHELKLHQNILDWCNEYLKMHPEYQKPSYLIICICKNIILPKCKICGKQLTYINYFHSNTRKILFKNM